MRKTNLALRAFRFQAVLALAMCTFSVTSLAQRDVAAQQEAFNEALNLRADGDVQRAAKIFQSILKESPLKSRVRLELAITYYMSGQFSEARTQVARILEDETIPQNVRNNSELFLARIQQQLATNSKDNRNSTFTGSIQFFSATDSNANAAPEDTALDIGNLSDSFIARSDDYVGGSANMRHRHALGDIQIAGQDLSLEWQNGFTGLFRQYQNEDGSDLGLGGFYTGFGVRSVNNWASNIRVRVDQIRLGGEDLAGYYSILPSYTHLFGASSLTIAASYTHRDYFQEGFAGREGYRSDLALYWMKSFSGGLAFRLGLQAADTNLEQDWQSYSGLASSAVLRKRFNSAFSTTISMRYENNSYDAHHPNYSINRDDDLLFASLSMQYVFTNNIRLESRYIYTDRQSSNDIFSYDRSRLELSLGYGF